MRGTDRGVFDDRRSVIAMAAQGSNEATGGGRDGCSCSARSPRFLASDSQNDAVAFGGYNVGADLIEIENDARHVWGSTVLGRADLAHSIGVNGDVLRAVVANSVGKIQKDAVRIDRSFHRGLYRSTDGDLDPKVGSLPRCGYRADRRRPTAVLCRGTRQQ